MPAVFISGIITNEGEWKRATCVCANEIATVEHFAPGRKKCSVHAHILLVAYVNGAILTRALLKLASSHIGEAALTRTENVQYLSNKSKIQLYRRYYCFNIKRYVYSFRTRTYTYADENLPV